jgi:hypothetical protein
MRGWDIGNYVTGIGRAADSSRRKGRAVRNDKFRRSLGICRSEGVCFKRLPYGQAQDE